MIGNDPPALARDAADLAGRVQQTGARLAVDDGDVRERAVLAQHVVDLARIHGLALAEGQQPMLDPERRRDLREPRAVDAVADREQSAVAPDRAQLEEEQPADHAPDSICSR